MVTSIIDSLKRGCLLMSKGSRQRPTDKVTFDDNFDRIFLRNRLPVEKECMTCGKLFAINEGVLIANAIGGEMLCPKCSSPNITDYKGASNDV